MAFLRQENWSGLPFSSPGDLPHPGIEPVSPALAGRFFTTEPQESPYTHIHTYICVVSACIVPVERIWTFFCLDTKGHKVLDDINRMSSGVHLNLTVLSDRISSISLGRWFHYLKVFIGRKFSKIGLMFVFSTDSIKLNYPLWKLSSSFLGI